MTQIVENFNMNLLLTLRSSLKNISASDKPPKWVFFGKKKVTRKFLEIPTGLLELNFFPSWQLTPECV